MQPEVSGLMFCAADSQLGHWPLVVLIVPSHVGVVVRFVLSRLFVVPVALYFKLGRYDSIE
jgi:hypothetical protein